MNFILLHLLAKFLGPLLQLLRSLLHFLGHNLAVAAGTSPTLPDAHAVHLTLLRPGLLEPIALRCHNVLLLQLAIARACPHLLKVRARLGVMSASALLRF